MTGRGLSIEALTVRYDDVIAVDDVDLSMAEGEIVSILGPSGCGKSTLLRAIAGLVVPDTGTVRWDGRAVTRDTPHTRGFGLMFQDHALFPHLDVGDNIAFGLRMRGLVPAERRQRTHEMLELVGLATMAERAVGTLSGGEAQRVALARALAPAPRLLMLDEPFGSLDRVLREHLTAEVGQLLRQIGVSAIHVTHDQDEALSFGDRVAVMRDGHIERIDTPDALWRDPRSAFVAHFLGHANIVDMPGRGATLIRADAVAITTGGRLAGTVLSRRFRDGRFVTRVDTPLGLLVIEHPAALAPGTPVSIAIDDDRLVPISS